MNQQQSRRFRTAKEAKELKEKAERDGEKCWMKRCLTVIVLPQDPIHGSAILADAVFFQQEGHKRLKLAGCRVVFSGRANTRS